MLSRMWAAARGSLTARDVVAQLVDVVLETLATVHLLLGMTSLLVRRALVWRGVSSSPRERSASIGRGRRMP